MPTNTGSGQDLLLGRSEAAKLEKVEEPTDYPSYEFDCREERPENLEDIQEVQKALRRTYDDFAFNTNVPPSDLDHRASYLDQWNSLQVQLQQIWATKETKGRGPPQLFALGKWTDSFENWATAPRAYLNYM